MIFFLLFGLFFNCFLGSCLADQLLLNGKDGFPFIDFGYLDGSPETKVIHLKSNDCKVIEDDLLTRIVGASVKGKRWEIDLPNASEYFGGKINFYLGDLDQNGQTDIVIKYSFLSVGGSSSLGSTHFLTILFDEEGLPHIEEFLVQIPSKGPPFGNVLKDSQGRAVFVIKRMLLNNDTCSCFASFYKALNNKWEKLLAEEISLQNPTKYSSFDMNTKYLRFKTKKMDQAIKYCSGIESKWAPDYGTFDIHDFKKIKSFELDKNGDFKFYVFGSQPEAEEFDITDYESCYFVIEKENEIKILNHEIVTKEVLDELTRDQYHIRFENAKNTRNYSIYFEKSKS